MNAIAGQQIGFGIIYGFQPYDSDHLIAEARHAESLGFDLFCVADHLHGAHRTPEPWTALTWVAAVTERIGVMTNGPEPRRDHLRRQPDRGFHLKRAIGEPGRPADSRP